MSNLVRPGDVVVTGFAGAQGVKRRPAVVLSSELYRSVRPDVILGVITSQIAAATTPTDWVLRDWGVVGLHKPSAFRVYLLTMPTSALASVIGHLSDSDWQAVRERVRKALDL